MKIRHAALPLLLLALLAGPSLAFAEDEAKEALPPPPPPAQAPMMQPGMHPGMMMQGGMMQTPVSTEKMEAFHAAMQETVESQKKILNKLPDLFKRRAGILNAEKFDAPAFLAVERGIASTFHKAHEIRVKKFAKLAVGYTPEERQFFAMMLEGPRPRMMMPPKGPMMGPMGGMMGHGPHLMNAAGAGPMTPPKPEAAPATKGPVEDAKPELPAESD
jgi:hypothetical protein